MPCAAAALVAGVAVESLAVTIPFAVMLEKVTLSAAPRPRLVRVAPGVPPEAKVSA